MHIYERLETNEVVPRHYVPYAKPRYDDKGNEILRDATVKDLKKMLKEGRNVAASVTSVMSLINKPSLNNWLIGEHLKQAYENGAQLLKQDSLDSFSDEVKRLTNTETSKARDAGTDFHAKMEATILAKKALERPSEEEDLCWKTIDRIDQHLGKAAPIELWEVEKYVYSDMGYGGTIDLYIPGSNAAILDYKSKRTKEQWKPGKMHYWDEHLVQLVAYRNTVHPGARMISVFVCLETGDIEIVEWNDNKQNSRAWWYFLSILRTYKIKNDYMAPGVIEHE